MNYLGVKALDCLRVADAAEDPDEYVYRHATAIKRHQEKPLTRKFEELTRRGYTLVDPDRHLSWRLTPKGEKALAEHLGLEAIAAASIPYEVLMTIGKHAGEVYPEECCGAIFALDRAPDDASGADVPGHKVEYKVFEANNVQGDLHKRWPQQFVKDGRSAYTMHPEDIAQIFRRMRAGESLVAIYHSHCDSPPLFSRDDAFKAMKPRQDEDAPLEPLMPAEVTWLVMGISPENPEVNKLAAYRWHPVAQDFLPVRAIVQPRTEVKPERLTEVLPKS